MPNIPIPDLTPGKIYDLRIQYVGGITGYLYWSDVVRCMVNKLGLYPLFLTPSLGKCMVFHKRI